MNGNKNGSAQPEKIVSMQKTRYGIGETLANVPRNATPPACFTTKRKSTALRHLLLREFLYCC